MLRAARQFLEENFIKNQTITGATVYKYNPDGYTIFVYLVVAFCLYDLFQLELHSLNFVRIIVDILS